MNPYLPLRELWKAISEEFYLFSFPGRMAFNSALSIALVTLSSLPFHHKERNPLASTLTHTENSRQELLQDSGSISGLGTPKLQMSDLVVCRFHSWKTWEFVFLENSFLQILLMSCRLVAVSTGSSFSKTFFTQEQTGPYLCLVGLVSLQGHIAIGPVSPGVLDLVTPSPADPCPPHSPLPTAGLPLL